MDITEARDLLKRCGLRVTPQRLMVLEALFTLRNHPMAEQVAALIRTVHPNIAIGTVYNTLDSDLADSYDRNEGRQGTGCGDCPRVAGIAWTGRLK